MFFIHIVTGSLRSKSNSIPWSGWRLNRYISPVARSWAVAATSAVTLWPLMVRLTAGSVFTAGGAAAADVAIAAAARKVAKPRSRENDFMVASL